MAVFYFLLVRRVRQRVALLVYAFVVYASATAVLFLYAVALRSSLAPVGDLPRELLLFAPLPVIPQIGGHPLLHCALLGGAPPGGAPPPPGAPARYASPPSGHPSAG